jgi:hypothetical protein
MIMIRNIDKPEQGSGEEGHQRVEGNKSNIATLEWNWEEVPQICLE